MTRCPITYEETDRRYSKEGLRQLNRRLEKLDDLPFTTVELRQEAARRADKLSIQGVQPKLIAELRVSEGRFELVDSGGRYILKPPLDTYPQLPENEDVTMRMAAAAGIEVPLHGLLYTRGDEYCYFIRRFDRTGRKNKIPVEDFSQLLGETRDTKYDSSMERVANVIDEFCTFSLPEKARLFRRVIVAYVTGNEDMHLKNFSLITRDEIVSLSPAYDMVNSTIALGNATEEMALPLRGKKSKLTREELTDYYGRERLGLTAETVNTVLSDVASALPVWHELLDSCFLSEDMRNAYRKVIDERCRILELR